MGVALENARLFDETQRLLKETEQRNAELAVINSVQQGLAAELDFQAIIDVVGDKLREVFATPELSITWYDESANLVHFMYVYEHGNRLAVEARPPTPGGVYDVIRKTRAPFVLNNAADYARVNMVVMPGTDQSKSMLSVPIFSGDRFLGDVSIENYERENAFSESDVRLVSTVSASLGSALENARLFNETQRLFKESEQRAAELAIINSVQQALAAELNMQGIYDAVGEKIREIFNQADVGIRIYDPLTNMVHFPYLYEHGKRMSIDPHPMSGKGLAAHVLRTRETLVINEDMASTIEKFGSAVVPGTQMEKSSVFVPLVAGDQVRGVIDLVDMEREHAFSPSDVRLLQTLANSMSVALENARLFDETQRLFKESEQRAAELAIINSVQAALATKLDIQGIYDVVGDKIGEIFPDFDVELRICEDGLVHFPYCRQYGRRLTLAPVPLADGGFQAHVFRTRQTLVVNEHMAEEIVRYGSHVLPGAQAETAAVYVPLAAENQVHGLIKLMDMKREFAFSDSDVRLLETLANSLTIALENARLFDETQRRTRETAALSEVGRHLSSTLDLATVMDRIADHAKGSAALRQQRDLPARG